MAELVSRAYAKALFEAGLEVDNIKGFSEDLSFIDQVFKSEDKLIQILSHPKINKSEKKKVLKDIFGGNVAEELINFLYILIDKDRERNLFEVIEMFENLYDKHAGILRVVAVTAISMEEQSKENMIKVLKSKLNKEIRLSNEVDKSILGGVLLKLEGKFIDNTLLGQLKSMETFIKSV